jgi:hypothetical protein
MPRSRNAADVTTALAALQAKAMSATLAGMARYGISRRAGEGIVHRLRGHTKIVASTDHKVCHCWPAKHIIQRMRRLPRRAGSSGSTSLA